IVIYEYSELVCIDEALDDIAHVKRCELSGLKNSTVLGRIMSGFQRFELVPDTFRSFWQGGHDVANDLQSMVVVFCNVVGHTGGTSVYFSAAEFFRGHNLPGSGFHQRGTAEEDCPLVPDNN